MTRRLANTLLLAAAAIWGLGFIAQSTAMDAMAPIVFTGLRFLTAAFALLPLALWEIRRMPVVARPQARQIASFALAGSILFLAMAFQQAGLVTTTVTNSGFLTGTYVLIVPVLAIIILRQHPHPIVWPCAAGVLAGIYLLSGGQLSGLNRGDMLTLICAVFWAFHVLAIGVLAGRNQALFTLAFVQFLTCGLLGTAIGLSLEGTTATAVANALPEILFAGAISGGVAFTIQIFAQKHTTASQAAIFLSTEALFAALFGALFLAERLSLMGAIGCGLIFASILAVQLAPERQTAPGQSA